MRSLQRTRTRVISLTSQGQRAARLRLGTVRRGVLVRALELTGEIAPDPDRIAVVGPPVTARVAQIDAQLGQSVEAGHTLALVQSTEFGQVRGQQGVARARLEQAQAAFDRQRLLHEEGIASAAALERAQADLRTAQAETAAAQSALTALGGGRPARGGGATIALRAPIAGAVVTRNAVLGQSVGAEDALFTVADLSQVWAVLRAFERDLGRIRLGADVVITLDALPDRTFEGRVSYLDALLDEATRTASVRVELTNEDGALRPGMFCRARIVGAVAEQDDVNETELLVPVSALQTVGGRDVVFVPTGEEGSFEARAVRLGELGTNDVAIEAGIREGEQVVVEGALTLRAELERSAFAEEDED